MRLIFFSGGSYIGGFETVNLELMLQLQSMGVTVHAVVNGWNDGIFPKMLEAAGVPYSPIKLGLITGGNPFGMPISWMADGLRHLPSSLLALSRLSWDFRPSHVI